LRPPTQLSKRPRPTCGLSVLPCRLTWQWTTTASANSIAERQVLDATVLGDRDDVYEIDYQLLNCKRKTADGFVRSHMNELRDPKAVATMGFETGIGFMPFGGEAYEVFKQVRKDERTPVRVAAAKELATDRDPKINAALARACSDKRWAVRTAAIYAIAKRDNPALLTVIAPALEDKNEIVRYEAAAAVLRLTAGGNK
jgi:HEAT repeat protein